MTMEPTTYIYRNKTTSIYSIYLRPKRIIIQNILTKDFFSQILDFHLGILSSSQYIQNEIDVTLTSIKKNLNSYDSNFSIPLNQMN